MNKEYIKKTLRFYRFRRPSFMEGLARIFDFSQSMHLYNPVKVGPSLDKQVLASDWKMVGEDLKKTMEMYGPRK